VAVFAGELSGDLQAASLVREMDALCGGRLEFWGIGGANMAAAGVELAYDSSHWGAMGVIEALKLAPRLLWVLGKVRRLLARRSPGLVILVDFGAFNVRVAAAAKRLGLPVFYYFPPGSWRRTPGAAGQLPQLTDRVATPFPWSAEILRAAGADAHYVGHPLVDLAKPERDREAFCAEVGLDPTRPIVCYLPGSRQHEIRDIWPPMAEAARLLSERDARLQHMVVQASSVRLPALAARGTEHEARSREAGRSASRLSSHRAESREPRAESCPFTVVPAAAVHDALHAADLAVTKAGSVTLEIALHQRPMVVIYRGSWLQELEYRLWHRSRIRFIAMPNILADQSVCPELIQREASAERIAQLSWELLTDTSKREAQTRKLGEVAATLGPPGAARRAAELALAMLP
jgi:lipid-A-disaccharide synthase